MSDLRDQIDEALAGLVKSPQWRVKLVAAVARRIEPEIDVLEQQIKAARGDAKDYDESAARQRQRAELDEAAVERARDVCARMRSHPAARPWADAIDRARDQPEEGQ